MTSGAVHQAARRELRQRELFRLEFEAAAVRGLNNWSLWRRRLSHVQSACLVASAETGCIIDAWDINRIGSTVRLTTSDAAAGTSVALEELVYVDERGHSLWRQRHNSSIGAGRVTRSSTNVALVCRGTGTALAEVGCQHAVSLVLGWCGGQALQRVVSASSMEAGTLDI